ncbi:MAG: hypothetical protein KDA58_17580, partial [Planctomycetaceae bacterium]|nr:hypothetical protein [Planctomycetaceae bacterium]
MIQQATSNLVRTALRECLLLIGGTSSEISYTKTVDSRKISHPTVRHMLHVHRPTIDVCRPDNGMIP